MKKITIRLYSILLSFMFILLLNSPLISAGLCKNDRGDYYYCEKYSRYNECDFKSRYHNYYDCRYSSGRYYNYDRYYMNYYNSNYAYYDYNYTSCSDYHYFKDIYDYDVYRRYCSNERLYSEYKDKYGNIIRVTKPNYRRVVYYDYTDNPLYPDYYKYQVEQQNSQTIKLKPPVIYVS